MSIENQISSEKRKLYAEFTLDTLTVLKHIGTEDLISFQNNIALIWSKYFSDELNISISYLTWLFAQLKLTEETLAEISGVDLEEVYFDRGVISSNILDSPEYLDILLNNSENG